MIYTISEVAEIMHLTPPTLRYYDKEGLLPFVERSASGIRMFKEVDFAWIRLIGCLKSTGMPIKDIKQFIDWYINGDSTIEQRRQMFYERREAVEKQLQEMQTMLDIVEYKCWYYDKAAELGSIKAVDNVESEDMPEKIRDGKEKLSKWHCK